MNCLQNLESINPDLNSDVMSQVDEIIDRNKSKPGCLIPVLEEVQGAAGYLPVELQEYIGSRLNLPGSNIYGVVTFCLGACGLAPAVVIDEDTHGLVRPDKMSDILSQYE